MKKIGESYFSKRGVSAVVATVLIVMITVAAVGIIWAAIIPMIKDNLGSSDSCKNMDVSVDVSQGYTCLDSSKQILMVQVKKGNENVNVSELKFLLSSGGDSVSYISNTEFSPNSFSLYYLNSANYESIDKLEIVPSAKVGNSKKTCSAISVQEIKNCAAGAIVVDQATNTVEGKPIINETKSTNDECVKTSECPDIICQSKNCNLNTKKCEYSFITTGSIQPGLCDSPKKCDGNGACLRCLNVGECAPQECKIASCTSGSCGYTNSSASTICSTGRCDGNGSCVTQCTSDIDCDASGLCGVENNTCQSGACVHTDKTCTVYTESFENGENGWSNTYIYGYNCDQDWNPQWGTCPYVSFWGVSSSDANDGSYSFSLKQHESISSERIDSPIINLSGISQPILEYYHKYSFDDCGRPGSFVPDGVVVEVFNETFRMIISPIVPDGYPFYLVSDWQESDYGCMVPNWWGTPVFSSNTGGEWQLVRFDLSSAVAILGDNIGIGFETEFDCANCNFEMSGQEVFYMDNIRITGLG